MQFEKLNDAGHERFARQFGEPDLSAVPYSSGSNGHHRLTPHNELVDVSNLGKDGQAEPVDSFKSQLYRGNSLFHVDYSYNSRREGYSILRAHQLPPPGTGRATEFADTRAAYDDLDDETKQRIKDYVTCHSVIHSRRLAAPDSAILRWFRIDDFPNHHHKLVQLHEPSGRKNLYIAAQRPSHQRSDRGREPASHTKAAATRQQGQVCTPLQLTGGTMGTSLYG